MATFAKYRGTQIKPVPLLNIQTTPRKAGKLLGLGKDYRVDLQGSIILTGSSELALGTPRVFREIRDFEDLWSEEGHQFVIFCGSGIDDTSGSVILSGYPLIEDISFNYLSDNFTQRADYTVTLVMDSIDGTIDPTGFNKKYSNDTDSPEYFLTTIVQGTNTGTGEYYGNTSIESWDETWDFNLQENRSAQYFNNNYGLEATDPRITPSVIDASRKLSFTLKPSFLGIDEQSGNGEFLEDRLETNYSKGVRIATGYLGLFPIDEQAPNQHYNNLFSGIVKHKSEVGDVLTNGDWFNHRYSINANPNGLSFDITETASYLTNLTTALNGTGYAVLHDEEYSFTQDGVSVTVSVNGTIQGFERNLGMKQSGILAGENTEDTVFYQSTIEEDESRNSKIRQATEYFSNVDIFASASGAFDAISGALYQSILDTCAYKPLPLQNAQSSKTVGINPLDGTVSYSITYDNKPQTCFTNDGCILSTSVDISDTIPSELVAQQNIIGRGQTYGPIFQSTNSWTAKVKSINIEIVSLPATGCATGNFLGELQKFSPSGTVDALVLGVSGELKLSYDQVFLQSDSSTYNPFTGRYTRNTEFLYGTCGLD